MMDYDRLVDKALIAPDTLDRILAGDKLSQYAPTLKTRNKILKALNTDYIAYFRYYAKTDYDAVVRKRAETNHNWRNVTSLTRHRLVLTVVNVIWVAVVVILVSSHYTM